MSKEPELTESMKEFISGNKNKLHLQYALPFNGNLILHNGSSIYLSEMLPIRKFTNLTGFPADFEFTETGEVIITIYPSERLVPTKEERLDVLNCALSLFNNEQGIDEFNLEHCINEIERKELKENIEQSEKLIQIITAMIDELLEEKNND